MNILVADDHALIREGLRMVLRDFDPNLVYLEAFDGASVERMLSEHPEIDLLLLDRRLPDCDGMDLLVRLVAHHPALPIVMISAELEPETVTRAIDLGAAGFIPKTSVTTLLVSALKLILAGGIYIPAEALRRNNHRPVGAAGVAGTGASGGNGAGLGGAGTQGPGANGSGHNTGGGAVTGAGAAGAGTAGAGAAGVASTSIAGTSTTASGTANPSTGTTPADLGLTDRQTDVLALLMEGKSNKQISRELDLAEATVKVHVRSILRALDASSRTEAVVAASRLGLAPVLRRPSDTASR